MNELQFTIHHSLDEKLKQQWQKLWEESEGGYFHNSLKWFQSCVEGLEIQSYSIITVTRGDQLEAIFPLVCEKRFGISALCNPGERFTDKSTLLLRKKDPKVIRFLMQEAMKRGNLYLEELSEEVADVMLQTSRFLQKQEASVNPYLPLQPDPYRLMRSKTRNQMRNTLKKYKDNLRHTFYGGDMVALEEAFKIDAISIKRSKAKSDLAREREREFFRQILRYNQNNFFVDILSFDTKPFVYLIGVTYKKTYHAWLTAFDGNYKFLSPGKLLFFTLFDRLTKEGYEYVDFSRGQTYVKTKFTNLQRKQYDVIYAKNNLVQYWWKLTDYLYNFVVGNNILYGMYRIGKRFFFR